VDFRLLRTLDLPSDEGRAAVTTTGAFELTAGEQVEAGTRVSWTVTVTNTTGADLHDLSVDGDARSETIAVLTPGETRQLHLETTVTAQDLAENRTRLVADLVGRTGDSPFSTHASGELAIGTEHPRLEASSTGAFDLEPGHPVTVGSKIVWTVTAKNTGDVSFLDLDPQGPGSIAAGETKVYQVADTVTQEDLDAGVVRRIFTATGARKGHPDYVSAPYLGVLPIPSTVDGVTTGTPTETGTGTETGTSTGTTTDTATAAGTTSVTGPSVSSATGDEAAPAGFVALAGAAGARPGAAAGSAPTAASPAAASPTPRRGGASAAHLAQTGVDASSALPAAGVLGLLGALGMLLGARRRRNRAAD
jgi:LPXTG-motif cell wall-anchored protein